MKWSPIKRAITWLLAFPPFALGWLAGFITKIGRLFWAALIEGYQTGSKL